VRLSDACDLVWPLSSSAIWTQGAQVGRGWLQYLLSSTFCKALASTLAIHFWSTLLAMVTCVPSQRCTPDSAPCPRTNKTIDQRKDAYPEGSFPDAFWQENEPSKVASRMLVVRQLKLRAPADSGVE